MKLLAIYQKINQDILWVLEHLQICCSKEGIDMFDCVMPTRSAEPV